MSVYYIKYIHIHFVIIDYDYSHCYSKITEYNDKHGIK